MMPIDTLALFFVTTLVVVLSPGPAAIAVTTEAASYGFKRSILVIIGVASANVVFFAMSATGIVALIIASSLLFSIIKWLGVAYLLYLGASALFSNAGSLAINLDKKKKKRLYNVFLQGFIIEISNPKALLYFSALLPQFVNVELPIGPQILILCAITAFLDMFCYGLYAYLGWRSRGLGLSARVTKVINKSAGCMLIFAGLRMATVER